MQLNDIKETTCPECGGVVVQETKKGRHCNGHYNETRVFECGSALQFVPNFMKTTLITECPKSKKQLEFQKLRKDAKSKIDVFVDALEVDERFKVRVKDSYKWI